MRICLMNLCQLININDIKNYIFQFLNVGDLCSLKETSTLFVNIVNETNIYQIFTKFYSKQHFVSLHYIYEFRDFEFLKYFIVNNFICTSINIDTFLINGDTKIITYLLTKKHPIHFNIYSIKKMIGNKHFDLLGILYNHNHRKLYDDNILRVLCRHGYLDLLIWYHDHNFLTDIPEDVYLIAAKKGNLDIINYLIKIDPYFTKNYQAIISTALHYGHFSIVKEYNYQLENIKSFSVTNSLINNSRELYDYFKSNNYELPPLNNVKIIESAIKNKFFDILSEIIETYNDDIFLDQNILVVAIINNRLDLLEWFYTIKPSEFYSTSVNHMLSSAILFKNYECIKWIFNRIIIGKQMTFFITYSSFYHTAISYKEYDITLWCFNQVVPVYIEDIIATAIKSRAFPILEWIKDNNYDLKYSKDCIINIFNLGYVDVAEYLKNSRYSLVYEIEWIDNIILAGHIPLLTYIYSFDENVSSRFTQKIFYKVLQYGHSQMASYLYSLMHFDISLEMYQMILWNGKYKFILWLKSINFVFPSKEKYTYDINSREDIDFHLMFTDIYFINWLKKNNFCFYSYNNHRLMLPDN